MTTTAGQRKNRSFRNGSGGKRKSRFSKTSHRRFRKSRRTNKTRKYLKRGGLINYSYVDIKNCKSYDEWLKAYSKEYGTEYGINYTFLASSLKSILYKSKNQNLSFDDVKKEIFPENCEPPNDREFINFLRRFNTYNGKMYFVINEGNKTIKFPEECEEICFLKYPDNIEYRSQCVETGECNRY